MTTEENDSYEEHLKNFREEYKQYPQMQPMSKDQYEAAKAAEEAKMKAAEEAGTTHCHMMKQRKNMAIMDILCQKTSMKRQKQLKKLK